MLAENICMKMDGIIAMEDGDIRKVHLQLQLKCKYRKRAAPNNLLEQLIKYVIQYFSIRSIYIGNTLVNIDSCCPVSMGMS